jgi:flagellar hook-associated protein 3 FlgL
MLRNMNSLQETMEQQRRQITTGKRVTKPEDDPYAAQQALGLRSALQDAQSQMEAMAGSREWLVATNNALGSIANIVRRAYTLAVRGGNDSLNANERDSLAAQVDEMLSEAIQVGNVQHQGQFIFAGFKTTTKPFALQAGPPTTWSYSGDGSEINRRVEYGEAMTINVTGQTVFPDVVNALIGLRDDLANNNGPAARNRVTELDAALGLTLNVQTAAAAKISRLESTSDRLETTQLALQELLSKVEDVNMSEAITRLTAQEYAYKVALEINARELGLSLLDFLK